MAAFCTIRISTKSKSDRPSLSTRTHLVSNAGNIEFDASIYLTINNSFQIRIFYSAWNGTMGPNDKLQPQKYEFAPNAIKLHIVSDGAIIIAIPNCKTECGVILKLFFDFFHLCCELLLLLLLLLCTTKILRASAIIANGNAIPCDT